VRRIALIAVIVVALFAGFEWLTWPDTAALRTSMPSSTAFMRRRARELRAAGKDDTLQYVPVAYARISPFLRRAVLVAEDDAFYEHEGVDLQAMREAIEKDWSRRKITHGGSTITQQLAKNLYLSPSRNPFRKVKEYFLARSLERNLSKKRILELYLNVVEFGERTYGAEAASRHYFRKPASALTPSEAALLAGCLPNPRLMNPGAPNKRLRFRQRMILSRMKRWGYLYEREVLTEKKPPAPPAVDTALDQPLPPDSDTGTVIGTDSAASPPSPTATVQEPAPASESSGSATQSGTTETAVPPPPEERQKVIENLV
jgi:monofunctional biosynthetic peptidoglycan transglycosylase